MIIPVQFIVVACFLCSQVVLQTQAEASAEQYRLVYGQGGSDKELDFLPVSFTSNCSYELLYNGHVFNSNDTSVTSTNYPRSKFDRTSVDSKLIFDYKIITLRLTNLNIHDSGSYTCSVTCPSSAVVQQYELVVIAPPKPASCAWLSPDLSPLGETTLQCSVVQGYPRGSSVCYTWNCEKAGSFIGVYSPIYMTGHSRQKAYFWIEDNSCIECCSFSERFPKTRASCRDFIYTPSNRTTKEVPEKASITFTSALSTPSPNENESNCIIHAISPSVLIFSLLVSTHLLL